MSAPLFTGAEFAAYLFGGIAVLCLVAMIARRWSQLPSSPPLYDYDDEVLPPPNVRSQRPQPDPYREWIIEE